MLLGATLAAGCGSSYRVTRVVDGRVVLGNFVAPEAYAAFLRGAIAEDAGDLAGAARAYEEAAGFDPDDPEVFTRLGAVLCRAKPGDPAAERALSRATTLDPEYAPAWEARATCAGHGGEALEAARRAASLDPRAPEYQVLLARVEGSEEAGAEAARTRLRALTLATPSSAVAYRALLAFARSHGDAWLAAEAIEHLAALGTSRRGDLVRETASLAGEGEILAARHAAAALVDHAAGGLWSIAPAGPARDLVARLAIDEALVRGDTERASRRATASHLGRDVVAGRALLLGAPDAARALAGPVVLADPSASSARVVLAVAEGERGAWPEALAALHDARSAEASLPPEIALPLFALLARATHGSERASLDAAVASLDAGAFTPGDDVTTRAAVELAWIGVVAEARLPAEARVELAARRGKPYEGPVDGLDARHALLAASLPRGEHSADATRGAPLARHLRAAVGIDPIVTVAVVRMALRDRAPLEASLLGALRRLAPVDPLVLETALAVARSRGDATAERELNERIGALGGRPARF